MTEKNKISVIVTAYNVENYIEKCLFSLVNQTISDIEIIVIDDGSTDSTPGICDEWGKKDLRIKVIHTQNRGVSAARNIGFDLSKGEWLSFVDGDDYVDSVFLEKMLECVNRSDTRPQVVICDYYIEKGSLKRINSFFDDNETFWKQNEKFIKKCWGINDNSNGGRFGTAWAKLYNKQFLNEIGIRFNEKISLCEDLIFNTAVFDKTNKCEYIKCGLYHYTVRKDSLTKRFDDEAIEKVFFLISQISIALKRTDNCRGSADILELAEIRLLNMIVTKHILNSSNQVSLIHKYNLYKGICSSEPFVQMIRGEGAYFSFKQKIVKRLLQDEQYFFLFILWLIKKGR